MLLEERKPVEARARHLDQEVVAAPGPVRDAIAEQMRLWGGHLADLARDAMARGELLERTDPLQLAFELDALGIAVNSGWQLHEDDVVFERGHRAIRRRLEADATERGRAALAAPVG